MHLFPTQTAARDLEHPHSTAILMHFPEYMYSATERVNIRCSSYTHTGYNTPRFNVSGEVF